MEACLCANSAKTVTDDGMPPMWQTCIHLNWNTTDLHLKLELWNRNLDFMLRPYGSGCTI